MDGLRFLAEELGFIEPKPISPQILDLLEEQERKYYMESAIQRDEMMQRELHRRMQRKNRPPPQMPVIAATGQPDAAPPLEESFELLYTTALDTPTSPTSRTSGYTTALGNPPGTTVQFLQSPCKGNSLSPSKGILKASTVHNTGEEGTQTVLPRTSGSPNNTSYQKYDSEGSSLTSLQESSSENSLRHRSKSKRKKERLPYAYLSTYVPGFAYTPFGYVGPGNGIPMCPRTASYAKSSYPSSSSKRKKKIVKKKKRADEASCTNSCRYCEVMVNASNILNRYQRIIDQIDQEDLSSASPAQYMDSAAKRCSRNSRRCQ